MKSFLFILCLAVTFNLSIQGNSRGPYTVETDFLHESTNGGYVYITRDLDVDDTERTFRIRTRPNSALDTDDYIGIDINPVTFPAMSATVSVSVSIVDDMSDELFESFFVRLSTFDDGTGTFDSAICIVDNEPVMLNCRNITADENSKVLNINVNRPSADKCGDLNITVMVSDSETFGAKGLPPGFDDFTAAEGGSDFTETMGYIYMPNKELRGTIAIPLIDDYFEESNRESFIIELGGDRVESCTAMGLIKDDDAPDPFHCNRRGQECYNGDCTLTSGFCSCDTGFLNPDCFLNNTTPGQTDGCSDECGGNGRCRNNKRPDGSDNIVCYCFPGYTGQFCNESAYHVDCNQNGFGFCITPYGNFQGSIFVYGNSSCEATMVDRGMAAYNPENIPEIPNWCEGHFLVLDYNSTCGDFGPEEDENGILTYTAQVYVQYGEAGVATDEIVTSYCSFDPNGLVLTSSSIYEVNADPAFLKKQTIEGNVAAASFSAKVGGKDIDGPIYIDDILKFCVSVEDAFAWDCVVIKEIEVNNSVSGEDAITRVLYDQGCFNETSPFVEEPFWEVGTERACFRILPIKLDVDSDADMFQMGIKVTAKIPLDTCTDYTTCSARRKRQASEEDSSYSLILNVAYENNPSTSQDVVVVEADQNGLVSNTAPVQQNSILPTVIGSVVGGTVFLVATTAIAFILLRRRRSKVDDQF